MITRRVDANALISTAISSHAQIWEEAKESEDYIVRMETPFDDEKLQEEAKWSHNYNYGRGRAELKQSVKENVSEINRSLSLLELEFEKFDKKKHNDRVLSFLQFPELAEEIAERLSFTFADFVDKQQVFSTFVLRAEYMNFLFGYAAAVNDPRSYLPDVVHFCNIAFEDHTHVNDIKKFVVFDVLKGDFFFDKLEKYKQYDAKVKMLSKEDDTWLNGAGWNVKALEELVCSVYSENPDALAVLKANKNPSGAKNADGTEKHLIYETWEDISILTSEKGRMWCYVNLNNISIAKVYELDDERLTESYVFLGGATDAYVRSELSTVRDILYQKTSKVRGQDDVIALINDFSIDGTNYIHDITGAGKMLAEHSLRYDIKRNITEDKLLLSGSILVTRTSAKSILNRSSDIQVRGGITFIGDGIELAQMQQRLDVSDSLLSLGQEKEEHKDLFAHYKTNTQLSNRPTKDEVQFVNSEAYSQRSSDIPLKLKAYSKVMTNAFKKLASDDFVSSNLQKTRKEFIDNIISEFHEYDLDEAKVEKILSAVKAVVINPVLSDREAIGQALSYASTSQARKRLTKMLLMSYGFSHRQVKDIIDIEEYGKDAEVAAFENAVFEQTGEVAFGLGQDHILHLNAHFYKVDRKFQGVSAGEDPVAAFNFARNALLNTRQHLNILTNNVFYQKYVKDFTKMQVELERKLKELGQMLDDMKKQAAKEGQQQGQPQITPEMQEKFYQDRIKLMNKLETSAARTKQAQELRVQQQEFNQAMKQKQIDFELQQKQRMAEVEVDTTLAKKAANMVQ